MTGSGSLGSARRLPDFTRLSLSGGCELALLPRPGSPVMTLTLIWQGGALTDPSGLGGAASLTAELLAKGTEASDALQLASRIESLGAQCDTWGTRETLGLTFAGPGRVFDRLWPIVREMLWTPRFDRREFVKTRMRAIESIQAAKDGDPRSLLPPYADGWIYGTAHPFGHPVMGDETSLGAIPASLMRATWMRHRACARTLVSVVGDFDPLKVEEELRALLLTPGGAERSVPHAPALAATAARPRGLLIDRPGASQGYFWIGGIGVDRSYADWVELELVHAALGGRFNSLINRRLRVERGLTYGAHSGYSLPGFPGLSYLTSYTPTETTTAAIEASLEVLGEAHEKGFPMADLEAARRFLKGQEVFRYETSGQLAAWLGTLLLQGRDVGEWERYPERLDALSPDGARQILNETFPAPEACRLVVIGDAERLLPHLGGLGEWTRHPMAAAGFGPWLG